MEFTLELMAKYKIHPFTIAGALQSVQMELISIGHGIHDDDDKEETQD